MMFPDGPDDPGCLYEAMGYVPKPKSPYKCPMHNFWMKKGQCEMCRLAADKRQRENERTGGSNKPPVKIGKI